MNYKVLPGKGQAFEDVFHAVLAAMNEMAGHSRTRLYRDVGEAASYLIVSDWSDRTAFDAFIASDQFRKVANWGKEQILAERPTHDYYEKPGAADSNAPAGGNPAGGAKSGAAGGAAECPVQH